MADTDLREVWAETLRLLEKQVTRPNFEVWLTQTRPLGLENGTLQVGVPNGFVKKWIAERLAADLQRAVSSTLARPIVVEFVVPEGADEAAFDTGHDELAAAQETAVHSAPLRTSTHSQPLNPRYTFDSFVIGSGNRLAHAASLAVAEAPARAYNPLFLYGGVGLGKTHLMQAIAHHVLAHKPWSRVVYISSETFTNELINAIGDRKTVDFRNRFRSVDVLLVDDIQFLAGKESTQEEFFHTFNALHEANRQIVVSSDRTPKEIPTLEERLRSRFEWGLISDIQPPDYETRLAILRKKAQLEKVHFPDEVLSFIAARIATNIRELEGALIRLVAFSSLQNQELTPEMAAETLKDILPAARPTPTSLAHIQEIVAEFYGLKPRDLKIRKRTRSIAFPRQVAMFLCRELTDASLPRIGEEFGGRDHTTVMHACHKIGREALENEELANILTSLRSAVKRPG